MHYSPFKHPSWVDCVAFSPNSQYLLTATEDGRIRLWDLPSGDIVRGPKDAHSGSIRTIAISPDGESFAMGLDDCTIRLWNLDRFEGVSQSRKFKSPVTCLSFYPGLDRKELASISRGELSFWDLNTDIKSHENGVRCLSYSLDGSFVAVGLQDRIQLWDSKRGNFRDDILKSTEIRDISKVACTVSDRIVSMSHSGVVAVWEKKDSNWAYTRIDKRESPPEQTIWGGIGDYNLGPLYRSDTLAVASSGIEIAFSYGGEKMVHIAMRHSIGTGYFPHHPWDHECGEVKALAYSPDNKFLAVAHGKLNFLLRRKGNVVIREVGRQSPNKQRSISSSGSSREVSSSSSGHRGSDLAILVNHNNGLLGAITNPSPIQVEVTLPFSSRNQLQEVKHPSPDRHDVSVLNERTLVNQNIGQVSIDTLWQYVSKRRERDGEKGRRDEIGESRREIRDWSGFLSKGKMIAMGGSAAVFKGEWKEINEFYGQSLPNVAIKVVCVSFESGTQRFWEEVKVWQNLKHRNILPFLGITRDEQFPALVSMLMTNGRVDKFIEKHPSSNRETMVLELARGLNYLHERDPPIVHGDIKPSNVFVDQDGRLVIGDFGLSKMLVDKALRENTATGGALNGTYKWMAPELLDSQAGSRSSTKESDIYAFGLTAWEIMTGKHIFDDIQYKNFDKFCEAVVENNERPPISTNIPGWLGTIFKECWSKYPEFRPMSDHALSDIEDNLIPVGGLRQSRRESLRLRFSMAL